MFVLNADTPLRSVTKPTLIMAMSARCGSTNLCSILAKLGALGTPEEYFNPRGPMPYFAGRYKSGTAEEYLARISEPPAVFCFKVAGMDWAPLRTRARAVFPNAVYIYLDRLDAHAQALSLYRAKVSNRWHMKLNEAFLAEDIPVNADELAKCAAALDRDKKAWLRFFFDEEIKPLSIAYEHMCDDMPKAVRMICAHVGVDVAQSDVPAGDFRQISRSASEQRAV